MDDREYDRKRKTRDNGGPPSVHTDSDAKSLAEKSERFAGLPYRFTEAFADGELTHEHVVIAWWVVSHITPPMWRYARTLSALSRELRWEEEMGKSQRTLQRRVEELDRLGWFGVVKPEERSRNPWIFTLGKVALGRLRQDCDTTATDARKSTPGFVAVDPFTGELLDQAPSGLEGGSVEARQYVDSRRRHRRSAVIEERSTGKTFRGVPR